jgi:hypothetical protein
LASVATLNCPRKVFPSPPEALEKMRTTNARLGVERRPPGPW